MAKIYVVYTKVLDWQLCSIERDYIKSIIVVSDTEEQAKEICDTMNTDNYEYEYLYDEFELQQR